MTKCAAIAETQGHSGPLLGTVITDAGSSRRRMDHQARRSVCHERCFERLCSHTRCSAVDGCVRRQGRPPRSVFSRANTMTRYARSFCTVANGSTGRRLLFMIRGDTICCALPGTERIEPSVRVGGATMGQVAIAEATETASQLLLRLSLFSRRLHQIVAR
jgi:hypothetical protein